MKNIYAFAILAASLPLSQSHALEAVALGTGGAGADAANQAVNSAHLQDLDGQVQAQAALVNQLVQQIASLNTRLDELTSCTTAMCPVGGAPSGLPPQGKDVTIRCSVASGLNQTLGVVLADGRTLLYNYPWAIKLAADGRTELPTMQAPIIAKFDSKPIAMVAYHDNNLPGFTKGPSVTRTYNQGVTGFNIDSEDGTDNDYNDLMCTLTW